MRLAALPHLVLPALLLASASAGAQPPPAWPSFAKQLAQGGIRADSALARLVAANQDFGLLRPEEAADRLGLPPWLRVMWRKSHPASRSASAADTTGGYPLVLKEAYEWMLAHQDLRPGSPSKSRPAGKGARGGRPPVALSSPPAAGGREQGGQSREEHEAREADNEGKRASEGSDERISGAVTSARSESDIRINPWQPQLVIAASNDIGAGVQAQFFSADGGLTWGQSSLPPLANDNFQSDPMVDWTSDGTAWAAAIGVNVLTDSLGLRVFRSADHGATWTFDAVPSGGQSEVDKEVLWVDHDAASPFKDTLYATWHNGQAVYLSRRAGPAAGTGWQAPLLLSGPETTGTGIGGDLKTNALGHVFAFWPDTGSQRIWMAKSTNGGTSFGAPVAVAATVASFTLGVPAFSQRRALVYVSAGTFHGAGKDLVYATWTDLSGTAGCDNRGLEPLNDVASPCKSRIWFARSLDGGATWSAPVKLNDPAALDDQWSQHLTVDANGTVAVVYYDTVNDPGRLKADLWYQSSFDDGVTWTAPLKVSSAATDETAPGADSGNQYGDYNGLSGLAGHFFPSWTDRRAGAHEEIWTAGIEDLPCSAPGSPVIGAAGSPAAGQAQVSWASGTPSASRFNVYRALGTCGAHGAFVRAAASVAGPSFLDTSLSGGVSYAYQIGALDDATGLCESLPSACAAVSPGGPCTLAPAFAGLAEAASAGRATCELSLSWPAAIAACGGPVSYNVYRGTAPGFTPSGANRIASGIAGTSFTDSGPLASGTLYTYIVRAVDGGNGAEDGNLVSQSAFPTGPAVLTETFEGAGGFDTAGWTHAALSGGGDWAWSAQRAQSLAHSWYSAGQPVSSDRVLVSPAFAVAAGTVLSFWHTFAFEGGIAGCFDGGTLEASRDGGTTWSVLPDAAFLAGGFTGTPPSSFGNPIGGKRAWCAGSVGAFTRVIADLSAFAGSGVKLRWHEGDDESFSKVGWYVDTVSVAPRCSAAPVQGTGFYTLTPCRLVDTRGPAGPAGAPSLAPGSERSFQLTGGCGVPAGALAVSLNVTVVGPAGSGSLRIYPGDQAAPNATALGFAAGQTRANNAVIGLAADGSGMVKIHLDSAGAADVVLDVNGYFQ